MKELLEGASEGQAVGRAVRRSGGRGRGRKRVWRQRAWLRVGRASAVEGSHLVLNLGKSMKNSSNEKKEEREGGPDGTDRVLVKKTGHGREELEGEAGAVPVGRPRQMAGHLRAPSASPRRATPIQAGACATSQGEGRGATPLAHLCACGPPNYPLIINNFANLLPGPPDTPPHYGLIGARRRDARSPRSALGSAGGQARPPSLALAGCTGGTRQRLAARRSDGQSDGPHKSTPRPPPSQAPSPRGGAGRDLPVRGTPLPQSASQSPRGAASRAA